MSLNQVRKRGPNYTQEEKSLLLDLVTQYQYIIECKRTGGKFIEKKRETWAAITIKYNSNCSSGPRDTDQLKSLYDNMKQKSRKDVGESNKLAYINGEHNCTVTHEDVTRAKKNIKEDKIEMNKTGGGFWKPKINDNDAKVLAIIQDQVKPLCNPYDSASSFFKEADICTTEMETNNTIMDYDSPSCLPTQDFIVIAEEPQPSGSIPVVVEVHPAPKITGTPKHSNVLNKRKADELQVSSSRSAVVTATPKHDHVLNKRKALKQRKIIKTRSAEALKKLYFKKKCQNADLERKKLMMEILHMKGEHNLRMEILKRKEKNVQS